MNVRVVIPSKGREKIIADHTLRLFPDATICVEEKEVIGYSQYVPAAQILPHPPLRSLGEIRNWIMDNVDDDAIFMADDDIGSVNSLVGLHLKRYHDPAVAMQIVENAAECARGIGAMLFGFNQTPRPNFFNPFDPIDFNHWVGSAIGVVSKDLRWDDNLSLHPDIDFSAKNLLEKRIIFCDTRFHFESVKRMRSLGGNSAARSGEREAKEMAYIRGRWGKYISQSNSVSGQIRKGKVISFHISRRQK